MIRSPGGGEHRALARIFAAADERTRAVPIPPDETVAIATVTSTPDEE